MEPALLQFNRRRLNERLYIAWKQSEIARAEEAMPIIRLVRANDICAVRSHHNIHAARHMNYILAQKLHSDGFCNLGIRD